MKVEGTKRTVQALLYDEDFGNTFLIVGDSDAFGPSTNPEIYVAEDAVRHVLVASALVAEPVLGLRLQKGRLANKLVAYHVDEQSEEDRWWFDGRKLIWFDPETFEVKAVDSDLIMVQVASLNT